MSRFIKYIPFVKIEALDTLLSPPGDTPHPCYKSREVLAQFQATAEVLDLLPGWRRHDGAGSLQKDCLMKQTTSSHLHENMAGVDDLMTSLNAVVQSQLNPKIFKYTPGFS